MERRKFLVKGSAPEPYRVEFSREATSLSAFCSCPAGSNMQYCKHRFLILQGEDPGVVSDNVSAIADVASWLAGSDIQAVMADLKAAEAEAAKWKSKVSQLKRKLARTMHS